MTIRRYSRNHELTLIKQLPIQDQIECLFDKIAGLEELILMYQTIFKIAEKKAMEFSNEAALAVSEMRRQNE